MKAGDPNILGSMALREFMKMAPFLTPNTCVCLSLSLTLTHTHTHTELSSHFSCCPRGCKIKRGQPKKLTVCSMRLCKKCYWMEKKMVGHAVCWTEFYSTPRPSHQSSPRRHLGGTHHIVPCFKKKKAVRYSKHFVCTRLLISQGFSKT